MPTFHDGYQTQSAGVHIASIAPGLAGHIPRLIQFRYRAAATAHTMYVMKCCGNTAAGEEAASGQTSLEFDDTSPMITSAGASETLAANDWVVYQTISGPESNDIATVTGNVIQFNSNIGATIEKGAPIWIFGELGRAVHTTYELPATTTSIYDNLTVQGGIAADSDPYQARVGSGEPLLILTDNGTNPGFLQSVSGIYVPDSDQNMN